MTRVSVAERARLSVLIGRRALPKPRRGASRRIRCCAGGLPRRSTDRLVIAPQELRTADATRASEIYAGRFAFAGKVVICDRRSPFEMTPPSDEWAATLLGFGWLRHLRAADCAITRANARSLVDDWINLQGALAIRSPGAPTSCRAASSPGCRQAPLVLQDADVRFYRRFIRSLTRQVRYLRRVASSVARRPAAAAGADRAHLRGAVHAGPVAHLRATARKLIEELDRQILPDGGHISRNPGVLIELLLDLLPLRQVFAARNVRAAGRAQQRDRPHDADAALLPPRRRQLRACSTAWDRRQVDLLATVLAYDDARGVPVANAPHSGYQRHRRRQDRAVDGHRPPAAARGEPGGARRLPVVRTVVEAAPAGGQLRPAGGQPRDLAAGRARDRRRIRPSRSTTRRHAGFSNPARCAACCAGIPIVAGPRDVTRRARRDRRRHRCCAPRTTAMPRDFGVMHQRMLRLVARRRAARRRGLLRAGPRRRAIASGARRIRHPLPPASRRSRPTG